MWCLPINVPGPLQRWQESLGVSAFANVCECRFTGVWYVFALNITKQIGWAIRNQYLLRALETMLIYYNRSTQSNMFVFQSVYTNKKQGSWKLANFLIFHFEVTISNLGTNPSGNQRKRQRLPRQLPSWSLVCNGQVLEIQSVPISRVRDLQIQPETNHPKCRYFTTLQTLFGWIFP